MDFHNLLQNSLTSPWSSPKWLACIVIEESSQKAPEKIEVVLTLRPTISGLIDGSSSVGSLLLELVPFLQTLRRKCQAMGNAFVEHGKLPSSKLPILPVLVQGEPEAGPHAFTFQSAIYFVEKEFDKLDKQLSSIHRAKAAKLLRETRDSIVESIDDLRNRQEVYERRVISAAASTILWLGDLENKLNPIIQGIMNAVKVNKPSIISNL
jgi:TATA-binding protein-associated factor